MKKSYKLFIFDFDGTLGDTKVCVAASFQEALRKNDLPIVNRKKIIHYMGISLKEVFKKLTNNKYNDELYEKLVNDYRIFYRDFLTKKPSFFLKLPKH
jgi:phosphoglycolate phosphatase-like HAD superfamily hydrolase